VDFNAVTQHISLSFLGFVCLQQLHANLPCEVKEGLTLGEYRRQLQELYQIRIGASVYMVNLSEQCESVDTILTDRILINMLSEPERPAKSDKPLTHMGQDKGVCPRYETFQGFKRNRPLIHADFVTEVHP